jgi:hypothetical protein
MYFGSVSIADFIKRQRRFFVLLSTAPRCAKATKNRSGGVVLCGAWEFCTNLRDDIYSLWLAEAAGVCTGVTVDDRADLMAKNSPTAGLYGGLGTCSNEKA